MVESIMSNPVGKRPWIPTAEDIEKAESLASRGMDQQDIAHCLGIGVSTYYDKKNSYPELEDAIKRGKAKGIAHVTEKLINNIDIGSVPAQIFYLKARAKWSDNDSGDVNMLKELVVQLIGAKGNGEETKELDTGRD